jgi:DNA-binding NarL/FixJ family response regulator
MNHTSISGETAGIADSMIPILGCSTTRLMVVDDHGIVREGLSALFDRDQSLRVVGSAATGEQAIETARQLTPDVIIMDLVLPDLNGLDASRQILADAPETLIIALSGRHSAEQVYGAFRAGLRGYVVKAAALAELILAVNTVRAGKLYVSPSITDLFADGVPAVPLPKTSYERLSVREREVLRDIVAGSSSADIAERLSLSPKTVDTYRCRLMAKLGVSNRWELVRLVMENELTAV